MTRTDPPASGAPPGTRPVFPPRRVWVAAIALTGILSVLAIGSALPEATRSFVLKHALLTFLFDGATALAVVAAMCGGGVWLVLKLTSGRLPARWTLLLGAALGLTLASNTMLVLGVCGVMSRSLWIGLLAAGALGGATALRTLTRSSAPDTVHQRRPSGADPESTRGLARSVSGADPTARLDPWRLTWLWVVPFGVAALIVAAQAPGYLWEEEGFGYDTLEYHLEMPKEYYEAGRITYAPHNVYANFPASVEMLYLICMVVWGGPIQAATAANYVHLALGILAVAAAWLAGREGSPRAGMVSAVCMAGTGWLVYLSGLAYVENGLLFYTTLAMAVWIRASRVNRVPPPLASGSTSRVNAAPAPEGDARRLTRLGGVSGALAGCACACKYTAVPMVVAPLALAWLVLTRAPRPTRVRATATFLACALIALSPWLIKNWAWTGNPVFPLANSVFHARPPGWSDESQQRWDAGHAVAPPERSFITRLSMFARRVILDDDPRPDHGDARFGYLVLGLGLVGLAGRRRARADAMLVLVLAWQCGVWLLATHLMARFAVVLLPGLALLAGRAALRGPRPGAGAVLAGLITLGAAWNLLHVRRMIGREVTLPGVASWITDGKLGGYEYFKTVNHELPLDAKLLLVGDAKAFYYQRPVGYTVVFNDDPFVEAIRGSSSAADVVTWLANSGYTHVLINWLEVNRLARSAYGFPAEVNPRLFEHLSRFGLDRVRTFTLPGRSTPYVELYEVRPGARPPDAPQHPVENG